MIKLVLLGLALLMQGANGFVVRGGAEGPNTLWHKSLGGRRGGRRSCVVSASSTAESPVAHSHAHTPSKTSPTKLPQLPALPPTTYQQPQSSRAVVVRPQITKEELTSLLNEVLSRLTDVEGDLRRVQAQTKVASRAEKRASKYIIDRRATTYGAAVAGVFAGVILGWSVLPNLWLVGGVAGAATAAILSTKNGRAGDLCRGFGIQVALVYKDVKDFYDRTVFLYRTGRLSYTYWRIWDDYDRRYHLTDKYNAAVARVSAEAAELDRQYQIRKNVLLTGKQAADFSRRAAAATAAVAVAAARQASGWGATDSSAYMYDRPRGSASSGGSRRSGAYGRKEAPPPWWVDRAAKRNGNGDGTGGGMGWHFGAKAWNPYDPVPAGQRRHTGKFGLTFLPDPIRQLFLTKEQKKDELLKRYRVGFLGRRRWRTLDE